jgi:hypothetical protein
VRHPPPPVATANIQKPPPTNVTNGDKSVARYRPPHLQKQNDNIEIVNNSYLMFHLFVLQTNGAPKACCACKCHPSGVKKSSDAGTQTISTGEITMTNVIY